MHQHDISAIHDRLTEAGRTLIALPAVGTRPGGFRSCMPDYLYDFMDIGNWTDILLRTPIPTAKQIERMDEVQEGWIPLITDHKDRRIVQMRMLTHPVKNVPLFKWSRIGKVFGVHRTTAKNTYERALLQIYFGLQIVSDTKARKVTQF